MKTSDFDYHLPEDRIALTPVEPKEAAKLLHVHGDGMDDRTIGGLPALLRAGDVLVLNDTRVIPARLSGARPPRQEGGPVVTIEITLHKELSELEWSAFAKPAKRIAEGDQITIGEELTATVLSKADGGECRLAFNGGAADFMDRLERAGTMPLPPYIATKRPPDARDLRHYQTAYARVDGAVAAPTAGLHLSDAMLDTLRGSGVETAFLTLHVGAGTFLPVKTERIEDHPMHSEWGEMTGDVADRLNRARSEGRRIVSVGTTSLRLLETAVRPDGTFAPFRGDTDIFITPGYEFRSADLLMTNFHLPKSTLLMLIYAFGGTDRMKRAYTHAIATNYRFYSYGDACLIERDRA